MDISEYLYRLNTFSRMNRGIYRIIVIFVFWVIILYSIAYNAWFIENVVERLASGLAGLVSVLLGFFGSEFERAGTVIYSGGFSMEIYYKCTGVYQIAGFLAGVFAYPTAFRNKIWGVLWGVVLISAFNIIRILSIFYVGLYFPAKIPFFHGVFWEALMIILTFAIWLSWAVRLPAAVPKSKMGR